MEAVYEVHLDDDPPEGLALLKRQGELAKRISGMRAHSADGIVAIARSLAVHNGNGESDFDPAASTTTGRLMTALMRAVCLLSGLTAPSKLAGRTEA